MKGIEKAKDKALSKERSESPKP